MNYFYVKYYLLNHYVTNLINYFKKIWPIICQILNTYKLFNKSQRKVSDHIYNFVIKETYNKINKIIWLDQKQLNFY